MSLQIVIGQGKNDSLILRPLGFGVQMEQFNFLGFPYFYGYSLYPSGNSFLISINTSNNFRIEPELGYYTIKDSASNQTVSALKYGLSLYGMFQKGNVNFSFGGRLSAASFKDESSGNGIISPSNITGSVIEYGPIIGAEYYVNRHFSFGANFGLMISSATTRNNISNINGSNNPENISYTYTTTGLSVRFYY